jgi:PAS domain S-box-containing protein
MVAPLVISLGQAWNRPPSRAESIEAAGVLSLLFLIVSLAVTHPTGSWLSFDADAVALPFLLWLVARCEPTFAIAGAFIVSLTVISATIFGIGHFGDAGVPIAERVGGAQVVIVMITLYTLTLTALFAQRKDAEERLAKKSAALAHLHEISSRLWVKRDLRQALDEILAGAIELLGADMGAIRMWNSVRGMLRIEAHRGFKPECVDLFRQIPALSSSACEKALQSGERMVVEDVEEDVRFAPFRPLARAAGYRAMQSTPILSREGAPLGMLATHFRSVHKPSDQDLHLLDLYVRQAADIIEHHKAVDALHESEERLRLAKGRLADAMAVGELMAFEWDAVTGLSQRSDNAADILGIEWDGLTGSPGNVFLSNIHLHDRSRLKECIRALRPEKPSYSLRFRYLRPDKKEVWLEETARGEFDVDRRLLRIKGLTRDITDRKQAEDALAERNAQLALAGKAVLVGTYSYDLDTKQIRITEGYAALHGLPEETTEIPFSRWQAGVHSEDCGRIEALRDQALRERRREYTAEYRIVRDGHIRWIEARKFISYDGNGQPHRVYGVNIDVTDRKRVEEQQRVLLGELDHRVKNSLATVSAVVSHTLNASSSMVDFATALDGRVQSMARTHELLSARGWQGISVAELVRRELAPYATDANGEVNGPEVILRPEAGQALAMVLHELATNAAKYGALSTNKGRVLVRWHRRLNGQPRSHLILEWREVDGPSVVAPEKSGFGTHTIRDLISYEFGGAVDLVFPPEGVCCQLELPADWLSDDGEPRRT